MTANRRDANPEIHASNSTANVIKLLQPAVLRFIIVDLELFIVDSVYFLFDNLFTKISIEKSTRSEYGTITVNRFWSAL